MRDMLQYWALVAESRACSSAHRIMTLRRIGDKVNKRPFSSEHTAMRVFENLKYRMLEGKKMIYQTDGIELWQGDIVCINKPDSQTLKTFHQPISAIKHALLDVGAASIYGKINTFDWMRKSI